MSAKSSAAVARASSSGPTPSASMRARESARMAYSLRNTERRNAAHSPLLTVPDLSVSNSANSAFARAPPPSFSRAPPHSSVSPAASSRKSIAPLPSRSKRSNACPTRAAYSAAGSVDFGSGVPGGGGGSARITRSNIARSSDTSAASPSRGGGDSRPPCFSSLDPRRWIACFIESCVWRRRPSLPTQSITLCTTSCTV